LVWPRNESQDGPWSQDSGGSNSQDATNDVLIDVDSKYVRELLGDMPAAESPISVLHADNRCNELRRRAFRAWPAAALRREQRPVLSFHELLMETNDGWKA
jgi:hypothetical protein